MANRKSNNTQPTGPNKTLQIVFALFSILLILSLILSALITPQ